MPPRAAIALERDSDGARSAHHQSRGFPDRGPALTIPRAHYQIIRQGAAEVPELTSIATRSATGRGSGPPVIRHLPFGDFDLNLRINADNRRSSPAWAWNRNGARRSRCAAPRGPGLFAADGDRAVPTNLRQPSLRHHARHDPLPGSALTPAVGGHQANTTAEGVTAILTVSGTAQRP